MAKFLRKNAWENGGTFNNPDLFWYAKGVGVLQSRLLSDENSWWFFAAIHGEQMGGTKFPNWNVLTGVPKVPTSPLPSPDVIKKFWNQCQHQSWYFTPWHRGYLIALEEQVRQAVISLGGPADWALPYWNYLGPGDQYKIPPAFMEETMPDGSANPLYVTARYGPKSDGNVYVPIPPISEVCQGNTIYTGSNTSTPHPGYGGPKTKFSHDGNVSGNLESNPHNLVHVKVGGQDGWMSDPDSAGLDPIFYLHHCNIDRMWAAWNTSNDNPTDPDWLNGPAALGEREFIMPVPGNDKGWVYTPAEMSNLETLDYSYDDLSLTTAPLPQKTLAQRLNKLGAQPVENLEEKNMDLGRNSELVGANAGQVQLDGSGTKTSVKLEGSSWKNVSGSLMKASAISLPDQVYLQLENVKGTADSNVLSVSVNHQLAGYVSLFGLRNASDKDGHNGGNGLTFILNITDIIDNLFVSNNLDVNSLEVAILPDNAIPDGETITVGRVSIYREQQKL
ncbi:tyrosinase family protein [Chryseobacterium indologenes]|uniref:Tyrosinase copper-binding domain-containing protein n=1 Tax=Chryseobacterium indologenes TaxID=253 RepID=A0A0N0ZT96_CHRID|nr:tyrosinase family protein [Chryseobacterium indologenes]KPE49980.1 hypothetical protein AOB46_17505 [Chryseobacterium indologenes]